MSLLAIAVGVLVVCALIALFMSYLITRAPYGYQDEDGFHYGEPPRRQRRRFQPGLHVVRDMSYFGGDDRDNA